MPSLAPGVLTQRKASTLRWPVLVVGLRPIARPGGLHHFGPPASSFSVGAVAVAARVDHEVGAVQVARERAAVADHLLVLKKLLTLSAKPSAERMPDARSGATMPVGGRTQPGLPASM